MSSHVKRVPVLRLSAGMRVAEFSQYPVADSRGRRVTFIL